MRAAPDDPAAQPGPRVRGDEDREAPTATRRLRSRCAGEVGRHRGSRRARWTGGMRAAPDDPAAQPGPRVRGDEDREAPTATRRLRSRCAGEVATAAVPPTTMDRSSPQRPGFSKFRPAFVHSPQRGGRLGRRGVHANLDVHRLSRHAPFTPIPMQAPRRWPAPLPRHARCAGRARSSAAAGRLRAFPTITVICSGVTSSPPNSSPLHDLRGQFVLERCEIRKLPVEAVAPDLLVRLNIDDCHSDSGPLSRPRKLPVGRHSSVCRSRARTATLTSPIHPALIPS
jgi:hypothetical protein